ncbi:MAG: hypothetical protein CBB71_00370 [Rhodopirellula sp. TMED11]|nr:MAG: hypothetical protein CBB71_00370 [Rhodopirellula sp. TMED11]
MLTQHHSAAPLLGVMAKYWTPGRVKTRLGQTIGIEKSAQLHRLFCLHLAQTLGTTAWADAVNLVSADWQRQFVVAPDADCELFQRELPADWIVASQGDGDLGDRINRWFKSTATKGHRVLIGADCPLIDVTLIDQALRALDQQDVVLGPAQDGGYYLIGISGTNSSRIEQLTQSITWSTETVYQDTCRNAEHAGLSVATLPIKQDVDTIDELNALIIQLKRHVAPLDLNHPNTRLLAEMEAILS